MSIPALQLLVACWFASMIAIPFFFCNERAAPFTVSSKIKKTKNGSLSMRADTKLDLSKRRFAVQVAQDASVERRA